MSDINKIMFNVERDFMHTTHQELVYKAKGAVEQYNECNLFFGGHTYTKNKWAVKFKFV